MGLTNKDWDSGVTQAVSGRAATEASITKGSDAVGAGWEGSTLVSLLVLLVNLMVLHPLR